MTLSRQRRDAEKARAEMEAYRAQCAAALETFDAPLKPEVAAKVRAFEASSPPDVSSGETYLALDLGSVDEDLETGCMIWTGYFTDTGQAEYPKQNGIHSLCGRGHFQVARALMEELLGHTLDQYTEKVFATCATNDGYRKPCVNPLHHEVKENT